MSDVDKDVDDGELIKKYARLLLSMSADYLANLINGETYISNLNLILSKLQKELKNGER